MYLCSDTVCSDFIGKVEECKCYFLCCVVWTRICCLSFLCSTFCRLKLQMRWSGRNINAFSAILDEFTTYTLNIVSVVSSYTHMYFFSPQNWIKYIFYSKFNQQSVIWRLPTEHDIPDICHGRHGKVRVKIQSAVKLSRLNAKRCLFRYFRGYLKKKMAFYLFVIFVCKIWDPKVLYV